MARQLAFPLGARLGPYEIVAPLGAGGMGEVYRARDTKLHRDVAIKVLPESFANDPDRLARFQREAQTLAALNHPNIAHIHGLEESGGVRALVMELVEGEDLSQRIARGAIGIDEALPIAKQIAEALEAAHEQGIIHRDLKPANIKLRQDGTVKVLDFGLAKAMEPVGGAPNVTQSPTITTPAMMTGVGVILGTAAYMAPEQARGKAADKRADIWAFGCVLYEMLTRRRAFDGDDPTDTIAAIMRAEPDWGLLPADSPVAICKLLRGCLRKDRQERVPDIAVARIEIRDAMTASAETPADGRVRQQSRVPSRPWLWFAAALAATSVVTGLAVWRLSRERAIDPHRVQRLTLSLPAGASYAGITYGPPALSPDGTRVVYPGLDGDKRMLYMRALDQLEPHLIPGTENALSPFFSRDGETVAFFTFDPRAFGSTVPGALKKVALRGGPPITICASGAPLGGVWADDGTIVFAASGATGPGSAVSSLFRVSAAGGTPREIPIGATIRTAAWPDLLPDGKGIIFSVQTGTRPDESYIALIPSQGGMPRKLIEPGLQARYASTGHIVYARDASLVAAPFDMSRPDAPGPPVPLVEGVDVATFMLTVSTSASRVVAYAISRTGTLIYSAGGPGPMTGQRTLEWVDRNGRAEALAAEPRAYMYPRISPDGTRVALDVRDKDIDIWMWDLARQTLSRVTDNPAAEQYPVWMPDGKRLLFGSNRGGPAANIYIQAADGSGVAERLTEAASVQAPQSVSPDGARLVFRENDPKTGDDLWVLSLDKDSAGRHVSVPLVRTVSIENNADVSPDGRWVAYQSNESGQNEVYVRPFPNADSGRWPVSSGGGTRPVWARSGRELFYLVGSSPQPVRLMRVSVGAGSTFSAGPPEQLFEGRYYAEANVAARGRTYDVSPDGQRFLMIKEQSLASQATAASSLVIVLNWFEDLKPRVSKD